MFFEAVLMHWLSAGKRPNGMLIRLQGFGRGGFTWKAWAYLSPPPPLLRGYLWREFPHPQLALSPSWLGRRVLFQRPRLRSRPPLCIATNQPGSYGDECRLYTPAKSSAYPRQGQRMDAFVPRSEWSRSRNAFWRSKMLRPHQLWLTVTKWSTLCRSRPSWRIGGIASEQYNIFWLNDQNLYTYCRLQLLLYDVWTYYLI